MFIFFHPFLRILSRQDNPFGQHSLNAAFRATANRAVFSCVLAVLFRLYTIQFGIHSFAGSLDKFIPVIFIFVVIHPFGLRDMDFSYFVRFNRLFFLPPSQKERSGGFGIFYNRLPSGNAVLTRLWMDVITHFNGVDETCSVREAACGSLRRNADSGEKLSVKESFKCHALENLLATGRGFSRAFALMTDRETVARLNVS